MSLIWLLAMLAMNGAQGKEPPDEVRIALEQPDTFKVRNTIDAIPRSVQTAFANASRERFSMAAPGAKWQSGDVVYERGLPTRRLLSVASTPTLVILFYERGGFAHFYHTTVFRISGDSATLIWSVISDGPVAKPKDLLEAIKRGTVRQSPGYMLSMVRLALVSVPSEA